MRIRAQASREQRRGLLAALERIRRPEVALEIARGSLRPGYQPETVTCALKSVHPDRFVLQLGLRSATGEAQEFALKVYADDFGEQMWALSRRLAAEEPSNHHGLCLPRSYVREERALVFPWVEGARLSEIVDGRKPELLRRAATLAAEFHRARVDSVPELSPAMVVEETLERCARVLNQWPSLAASVVPLMRLADEVAGELEPARPALIHGDMAAGQFLWTGDRLVLLDLDTACRGDPAYDVGHFLGQLERRCLLDESLPEHSKGWIADFSDAYPAASLGVSWRNVSFYRGVTLLRKTHTMCLRDPVEGPRLAARLAARARAAFETVVRSTRGRTA